MLVVISGLCDGLGCRLIRHVLGGPDLSVRMRVARAHHGAAILEDLHVADLRTGAQLYKLIRPFIDHHANVRRLHQRQRERVVGMEAENAATAGLPLGTQQWRTGRFRRGRVRQQRGVIIVKYIHVLVLGGLVPAGSLIART